MTPSARSRLTAAELIDTVLDAGTFRSWDAPIDTTRHGPEYQRDLANAAARAGTDEAVVTGTGTVDGRQVAIIVSEFGFLAGSIGRATANRIVSAVRRATAQRLPVLASTASGGTRMQEGTPAFVDMVAITRAVMDHRAAGLPYLVHLRHPTAGGVYASWASLGQVTIAEPRALIGFLGPKVYRALRGKEFPRGIQTAENLARKGVIDAVVPTADLRGIVIAALAVLTDPPDALAPYEAPAPDPHDESADVWSSVLRTRDPHRIGVRDLLRHAASSTLHLSGTHEGERNASMLVALTRLDRQPCVLIGQDRSRQTDDLALGPSAFREARRAMALAEELRLPLVTIIDTPGADLSVAAEEGAVAGEIARCIALLSRLRTPTVSVILGQGCGGGALALLPARRVLALSDAWLAPLPPEGASAILYDTTDRAPIMAEKQRIAAPELLRAGIVDRVIHEPTAKSPVAARAIAAQIARELAMLSSSCAPTPTGAPVPAWRGAGG